MAEFPNLLKKKNPTKNRGGGGEEILTKWRL
jgi:hypothetical protein